MIAVNIDVAMPSDSVTAKPLIGPVPNMNSTIAAISVVRFESTIVEYALSQPARMLACGDMPFASSSRMRSKISTFASTAMPTVSTMPAMPGSESCA